MKIETGRLPEAGDFGFLEYSFLKNYEIIRFKGIFGLSFPKGENDYDCPSLYEAEGSFG